MKNIFKLVLLLLVVTSCDLDREPYGAASFWKTDADVQLGVNSIYAPFYEEEGFGRGHLWYYAASNDIVVGGNSSKPDAYAITQFRTASNNLSYAYKNWSLMYQAIRRADDVIKNAPNVSMSESSRNKYLGEANFLAAFSYFFLAKRYGGLPFFDNTNPEEINKPRETKTETYRRIETYLLAAIGYFEKESLWNRSSEDFGRPNLGAAYGLLAKVYAHWGKFQDCKTYCEKAISSGKYALDTNKNNGFADLFSLKGEKNAEILFSLGNIKGNEFACTSTAIFMIPVTFSGGLGSNYFLPTKSLFDDYETGDLRRTVTILTTGDQIKYFGKTTIVKDGDLKDKFTGGGYTGNACIKFASGYEEASEWNKRAGNDIPLLRYSDVLLLHAEAILQLAGAGPSNPTVGMAEAAASLNLVRVRAFGNDATKAIAAPTFNDLVKERRCELAYEDERHFDLVRWGMAQAVYSQPANDWPKRTFIPSTHDHFPLPQAEIDNSNGVLINNPAPGYSSFQ